MNKVTKTITSAFMNGSVKKLSNTSTDGSSLFLFGNRIAERRVDGLYITNAGWQSNTTKERLNALPNVSINQKRGVWFLNGKEWDGTWAKVS